MGVRRTHVGQKSFFNCTKFRKVLLCLSKAQIAVGTAADNLGIGLILPVVFPKANWTQFKAAPALQRSEFAARATNRLDIGLSEHRSRLLRF